MRNVVLYQLLSLDGVAEEPGDWFFDADQAVFENLGEIIASQDAVLLGRRTYEYWVDYWPTSDVQPFADFINGTRKYVFGSTSLAGDWVNTTPVSGPAAEFVAALKSTDGGDIGIHGSIALARSLLRAGLVDELRLVLAPAVAAGGRRLFEDQHELQRLELNGVRTSGGGALLCHYRVLR
jgi:dihydrofolate reductase